MKGDEFPLGDETYQVLGACFEVYNEKGCGFLEAVYQECLQMELALKEVPFVSHRPLRLAYKGTQLRKAYEADFVCFEKVIVEIKAVSTLIDEHRAQLINYLHATGLDVGLLINFGHHPKLQYERIVNTRRKHLRPSALSAGTPLHHD